jgi:hypothetical protein
MRCPTFQDLGVQCHLQKLEIDRRLKAFTAALILIGNELNRRRAESSELLRRHRNDASSIRLP